MNAQSLKTAPCRRKIALALQGGGSHGAFTWGVIDRVLEEKTIEIIGVTGTSAGALNAALMTDGLVRGGPEQARAKLRQFWEAIGEMPGFGSFLWPMTGEMAATLRLEYTPAYLILGALGRYLSPYDLNPSNYNPLRPLLTDLIDFDRVRAQDDVQIVVCATNARKARRRIFTNADISVDAVLASACMPQMLPAVEIDGEPYWDGGFTGNPALTPLLNKMPKCDFIIVRIDPINRAEAPRTVQDIFDRIFEISFNATFWLELSALAVVLRFVDEGLLDREQFGRIFFHAIEASGTMEKFTPSSKLNNYPALLQYLFELGRKAADDWFIHNDAAIGVRSTVDLQLLLPRSLWPEVRPARPLAGSEKRR